MDIREEMYQALADAKIDVYLPGQYQGACKAPYVVLSDGGVISMGKSTGRRSFWVTGYAPVSRPMALKPLLAQVRSALAPLKTPRTSGEISPEDYDEESQAVFAAIEYTALCAI